MADRVDLKEEYPDILLVCKKYQVGYEEARRIIRELRSQPEKEGLLKYVKR